MASDFLLVKEKERRSNGGLMRGDDGMEIMVNTPLQLNYKIIGSLAMSNVLVFYNFDSNALIGKKREVCGYLINIWLERFKMKKRIPLSTTLNHGKPF